MGDVADVRVVKDVVVVAELEVRLVGAVRAHEAGEELHVAFAKDAGRSDRGGEQVRGLGTVGLEDNFFRSSLLFWLVRPICCSVGKGMTNLSLGVVLLLLGGAQDRPSLVSVEQVASHVADDAGRARVDESFDLGGPAGVDDGLRASDVDLVEERVGRFALAAGKRRSRVDDDVGRKLGHEGRQLGGVGDVALVIRRLVAAVLVAAQVDRGYRRAGPAVESLVDDVVTEETVAADDNDLAERASLFGSHDLVLCWKRKRRGEEVLVIGEKIGDGKEEGLDQRPPRQKINGHRGAWRRKVTLRE